MVVYRRKMTYTRPVYEFIQFSVSNLWTECATQRCFLREGHGTTAFDLSLSRGQVMISAAETRRHVMAAVIVSLPVTTQYWYQYESSFHSLGSIWCHIDNVTTQAGVTRQTEYAIFVYFAYWSSTYIITYNWVYM